MLRQGGVIEGCQKIYVAFTVKQVVKCNYRGWTQCRATTRQADWQEGKETSDQGLFIQSIQSPPLYALPSVSQTYKSTTSPILGVKTSQSWFG